MADNEELPDFLKDAVEITDDPSQSNEELPEFLRDAVEIFPSNSEYKLSTSLDSGSTPKKLSSKPQKGKAYERSVVPIRGKDTQGRPNISFREIAPSGDIYDIGSEPIDTHLTAIRDKSGNEVEGAPGTLSSMGPQFLRNIAKGVTAIPGALADFATSQIPVDAEGFKILGRELISPLKSLSGDQSLYPEGGRAKHFLSDVLAKEVSPEDETLTEYTANQPLRRLAQLSAMAQRGEYVPFEEKEQYPEYLQSSFYPRPNVNQGERITGTVADFIGPGAAVKAGATIKNLPKIGAALQASQDAYPLRSLAVDTALGTGLGLGNEVLYSADTDPKTAAYANLFSTGILPISMLSHGLVNEIAPASQRAAASLSDVLKQPGAVNDQVLKLGSLSKDKAYNKYFGNGPFQAEDFEGINVLPYDVLSDRAKGHVSPITSSIYGGELDKALSERQAKLQDLTKKYSSAIRGGHRPAQEGEYVANLALKSSQNYRTNRAREAGVIDPLNKSKEIPLNKEDAEQISDYLSDITNPDSENFVPVARNILKEYVSRRPASARFDSTKQTVLNRYKGLSKKDLEYLPPDEQAVIRDIESQRLEAGKKPVFKTIQDVDNFLSHIEKRSQYTKPSKETDPKIKLQDTGESSGIRERINAILENSKGNPYKQYFDAKLDYGKVAEQAKIAKRTGLPSFRSVDSASDMSKITDTFYSRVQHPNDAPVYVKQFAKDGRKAGDPRLVNKILASKIDDSLNKAFKPGSASEKATEFNPESSRVVFDDLYGDSKKAATTNALAKESALALGFTDETSNDFVKGFQRFNDFLYNLSPKAIKGGSEDVALAAQAGGLEGVSNLLYSTRLKLGSAAFKKAYIKLLSTPNGVGKIAGLAKLNDRQKATQRVITILNTLKYYGDKP